MLRFLRSCVFAIAPTLAMLPTARADDPPLQPQSQPEVIEIEAEAPPVTGGRMPVALRETPATVNVITGRLLTERGQADFVSALGNVAGISPALHYGGFDHLTIRGFGGEDFLILTDGFRDERHPIVGGEAPIGSMVGLDHVEVLKGPASALYGMSALGGVIHLVHKQPQSEPIYEIRSAVGSYGEVRGDLGMSGPVTDRFGDRLLYRLDLTNQRWRDFRDFEQRHTGATLALRWQVTPRSVARVRALWNDSFYGTDAGVPTIDGALPADADPAERYNSPYDHLAYQALRASADWEAALSDRLTLRERFSVGREREDYLSIEFLTATTEGTVERELYRFDHHFSPLVSNQIELSANAHVLVDHTAIVAYDLSIFRGRTPSGFATAPAVSLVDPVEVLGEPNVPWSRVRVRDQQIHGLMLADQISIRPDLKVALGGRIEAFRVARRTDTLDPETGVVTTVGERRVDDVLAPSFRAGAVHLPTGWLSTYASVSTSVRPVVPFNPLMTEVDFAPERGRQVEVGARVELEERLSGHVALYQLDKSNILVTLPDMMIEQAGNARSRGGEVAVTYHDQRMDLTAAYALTHAIYVDYESDGINYAGKRLAEVPRHSAMMWGTYRSRLGLGAGIGGRLVGRAYTDRGNTVVMPAYLLADAALFYERRRGSLWMNVKNVLGENPLDDRGLYYISTLYDTQVTPGPGRTVLVQLHLTF